MLTAAPPTKSAKDFHLIYGGGSADLSRVLFSANDALTAATPYAPPAPVPGFEESNLYEWHAGGLSLVNVLPGNASIATGAVLGSGTMLRSGNPNGGLSPVVFHAVSEDGSRVFWSDGSGQVYVREDGVRTLEIHDSGKFLSAGADGSEVLLSDGCLYDLETESCTDLTAGKGGFQGILGQGEAEAEVTHLYFVDTAVLAANEGVGLDEEGNPQLAEAGKDNLYSWHGGEAAFVATLLPSDNSRVGFTGTWQASPVVREAEASPNGRWLAFASEAPLTGYDTTGFCEVGAADLCTEAFLYDSATGKLTCPSCNPSGEAPLGPSTLRRIHASPPWLPQPRYLLDSGRLYFDSSDRLSPLDTNGRVEDVYEAEPNGVGGCRREAGCVSLISTGAGSADSNLLAVDETGKNVFFTTRERLVQKDSDELIDLYDAREGGGVPSETETQRAECQGEACQPATNPPNDATPASAAFHGAGNVKERTAGGASRCRKPARRAQGLSRRARKLRRNARTVARHDARKAERMRRQAAGLAKQARRQSKSAKRCRARVRKNRRSHR